MRVLFVYPSWTGEYGLLSHFAKRAGVYPPLNLALLAAITERAGFEAKIIDGEADRLSTEKAVKQALEYKPDVIALTGKSPFFHLAVAFAKEYKKHDSKTPICIGGQHITIMESKAFHETFDYGFVGECEVAWPAFLNALRDKTDLLAIKGILFRKNGRIVYTGRAEWERDLDSLPLPARHLLPMHKYIMGTLEGRKNFTSIQTMRGCPWRCIFCASEKLNTTKVDKRSPKSVVDEMEHVVKTYGIRHFIIVDDVLTLEKPHITEICDRILEKGLKITFEGSTRAHLIDDPLVAHMKKAGLIRLSFGLESANKEVREIMKKKVPLEYYTKANEILDRHNVEALNSVMIGLPGETRQTVQETLDFLRNDRHVKQANLAIAVPYPGTELYEIAKSGKHNMVLKNDDFSDYRRYGMAVTQVGDLTPTDLIELQNDGFVAIYSAPWRWRPMMKKHGLFGGILMLIRVFRLVTRRMMKRYSEIPLFARMPGVQAQG